MHQECQRQKTSKYLYRNSPAYPANKCCGLEEYGNDGKLYKSISNSKGICTWKLSKKSHSYKSSPRRSLKTHKDLNEMTVSALLAHCRKMGIRNYTGLKKIELINLIKRNK